MAMATLVVRLPDDVAREIKVWCLQHHTKLGDLLRAGLIHECRVRGIDVAIPVRGSGADQAPEES